MSLNDTPSGERAHIVFFGVRNAGKSSLVNALTNQTVSVVSDVAGTTTDPVSYTHLDVYKRQPTIRPTARATARSSADWLRAPSAWICLLYTSMLYC